MNEGIDMKRDSIAGHKHKRRKDNSQYVERPAKDSFNLGQGGNGITSTENKEERFSDGKKGRSLGRHLQIRKGYAPSTQNSQFKKNKLMKLAHRDKKE